MSLVASFPHGSIFRPTSKIFSATFNTPTAGQYDFGIAANRDQELLSLNPNSLYYLSVLSFSANIPESAYLENISTIPTLNLFLKKSGAQIFGQGYPLVTYMQGIEVSAFFWTQQLGDTLIGTFTGILDQNSSLSGVPTINSQCSLNVHEVTDREFIRNFLGNITKQEKVDIRMPDKWKDRV